MSKENRYVMFQAESGPVLDGLRAFWKARVDANKARFDFIESIGGNGEIHASNRGVRGVAFDEGKVPEGWRKFDSAFYEPNPKLKAGRAMREKLNSLQIPCADSLQTYLPKEVWRYGYGEPSMRGFRIYQTQSRRIGEIYILEQPLKDGETADTMMTPEGCRRLKLSEFHRLVEEFEEARKERNEEVA